MAVTSGICRLALRAMALAGIALLVPGFLAEAGPISLSFHDAPQDEHFGTVSVSGLQPAALAALETRDLDLEQWTTLFPVYTGEEQPPPGWPPVLGTYRLGDGVIRFRPRFPFVTGMTYRALFHGAQLDRFLDKESDTPALELVFTMPEPADRQATYVETVYPSTQQVPENLLRLYVYFSGPINPKGVQNHVHLYDASGAEIPLPFVEIENGLWDPQLRRLTLFFHPGRIKRGVAPNQEMGLPLRAGESFRLVIDRNLRDAAGAPLAAAFEKRLRVTAADRLSPDHGLWRISPPISERASLDIEFREPLDHALLRRFIFVEDAAGERVAGRVTISREETRWSLLPDSPWKPGRYTILVNPLLEDLAGNTLRYLFDEEGEGSLEGGSGPPQAIELSFRFQSN